MILFPLPTIVPVDLMSLLNWKSMDRKSIPETLGKIMKLDGEEVVKFLQDVLDALFGMFSTEDGNSTEHSGQVFHVLVSIIRYSLTKNPIIHATIFQKQSDLNLAKM